MRTYTFYPSSEAIFYIINVISMTFFSIWLPSATDNCNTWDHFKNDLNGWAGLLWKIKDPSHKTVFLDLNIQLADGKIHTRPYQKSPNLYIPLLSVHPPSCFKGLIAGEMHQYWLQNDPITFQDILTKFLKRLLCRGHTLENLISLVKHAASSIDSTITNPIESPSTANITINIHSVYQPNGLQ
jgi:hypothetical protein